MGRSSAPRAVVRGQNERVLTMNKRGFRIIGEWAVPYALFADFCSGTETTEDKITIKRRCFQRYTLRGIPAKKIDVLIQEHITEHAPAEIECQLTKKTGRFDGSIRDRIVFRAIDYTRKLPRAVCAIHFDPKNPLVDVFIGHHALAYERLRSDLEPDGLGKIWMWHFQRWYRHLHETFSDGDARKAGDSWAATNIENIAKWTLAEANRSASRDLYRISRELGWRKLTLREREKFNFDSMWIKQEKIADFFSKTGCSEYTTECARNKQND